MRSLMVTLPFVIVTLFWDKKKLLLAVMLIVIICLYLFSTQLRSFENQVSETDRLTINYMSLLLIKERPITGIGFSMETPANNKLIDHKALRAQVPQKLKNETVEYSSPHNMWLGLAVRLGLVGLLLFIFIVIQGAWMCVAGRKQHDNHELRLRGQLCLCLLVLFSVYGLFNEVFMHFLEALLCVLFATIALLYCEAQKLNNPEIVKATS
jgi:O-antigen ligase